MMTQAEYERQVTLNNQTFEQSRHLAQMEYDYLTRAANQNNTWSAQQVQNQMEFQERMSNTAHQREMEDLKAAGLNPILSAQSGATSPAGNAAQADGSYVGALANVLSKVLDIQSDNAKANLALAASENNYSVAKTGSSNYGYTGNSAKDVTGYDLNGILGLFGIKLPNSGANLLASAWNWFKNLDVDKASKTIDTAGKTVAEALDTKTPPKGSSSYKAYEYQKNTGKSSTNVGLQKIQNAVNKITSLFKGKKK